MYHFFQNSRLKGVDREQTKLSLCAIVLIENNLLWRVVVKCMVSQLYNAQKEFFPSGTTQGHFTFKIYGMLGSLSAWNTAFLQSDDKIGAYVYVLINHLLDFPSIRI